MWQDSSSPYGAPNAYYNSPHASGSGAPAMGPQHGAPLQFYAPSPGPSENGYYPGARPSLEGNMGSGGGVGVGGGVAYGGNIQQVGPWWTAFGTGGLEGEPPLLEGMSTCIMLDLFLPTMRNVFIVFQSLESTFHIFVQNQ